MTAPELSFLAEPGAVADWRLVLLLDVAADTGVLGALPGRADEVAGRLRLDPRATRIVLDALAGWGVVAAGADPHR